MRDDSAPNEALLTFALESTARFDEEMSAAPRRDSFVQNLNPI
jgi:hypothetical protein